MSENTKKKTAPYLPWTTFTNALDTIATNGVPNIIDRHSFRSFSGGMVAAALSALRFFDLIDSAGIPSADLEPLAKSQDDGRKKLVLALLQKYYADLFALDLSRATPGQLDAAFNPESFGVSGDTRVKAKTFFLKAAQFAEVTLSPLLLAKARSTSPRKKGVKKQKQDGADSSSTNGGAANNTSPPADEGTRTSVEFSDGGKLTLIANVNLLTLSSEDRTFLFKIIDLMQNHGQKGSA